MPVEEFGNFSDEIIVLKDNNLYISDMNHPISFAIFIKEYILRIGNLSISSYFMKILFYTFISLVLSGGCTLNNSDMTKLDSDDYESADERVEVLKKEIKNFSKFKDAEFKLFNVNGFNKQRTSVPGASLWDYKFVIRLDTANISAWTIGMKQVEPKNFDSNWQQELIKNRKQNWKIISDPEKYVREGDDVTMLVYRNEGIIYKHIINL